MDNIVLRPETAADEMFLRSLYAATRVDEMALTLWSDQEKTEFLNQQFDWQRLHYRHYYPDAEFMLVLLNSRPIGRWYLHRGAKILRLLDISLMPVERNQGIGENLLTNLMAEAAQLSKVVRLEVEKYNRARNLYLRLGFSVLEDQDVYSLLQWPPQKASEA